MQARVNGTPASKAPVLSPQKATAFEHATCSDELSMSTTKTVTDTSEVCFERFRNAVRHIVSAPKAKLIELEKRNGTKNGQNGKTNKRAV